MITSWTTLYLHAKRSVCMSGQKAAQKQHEWLHCGCVLWCAHVPSMGARTDTAAAHCSSQDPEAIGAIKLIPPSLVPRLHTRKSSRDS